MIRFWLKGNLIGFGLVLLVSALAFAAGVETIVISFEKSEGFPTKGGFFTGKGIPAGKVSSWTNDSGLANEWFVDDGPGGVRFSNAPLPVSGTQIAAFSHGGNGVNIAAMYLDEKRKLGLSGFYWAWRGNGDARPGGNAWLEVEYFDLEGKSVGKDRFQGGLNPDWSPRFDLAKPSIQGGALSKVVFRGVPPDPAVGHGTFFLDDVILSVITKPTAFRKIEIPVSAFQHVDTTPPTVNLATPAPDSTVSSAATISAKFADGGSGIDTSSARVLLDGKDVTSQAKVTAEGFSLQPRKPLVEGIHQVEVRIFDKAGNRGNRLSWRFGVDVPVPVKVKFDKDVFMVSGEPFFPMGIYNGSCDPYKRDNLNKPYLAQAGAAGINFQIVGESMGPEHLDIMLKHRMKTMKAVSHTLGIISPNNTGSMRAMAMITKDHPGMLGWWASDPDTMEKTRENMALGYQILKENDSNHPVIWILSHGDRYEESLATADALFVYFYPILQSGMTIYSLHSYTLKKAFAVADPAGKHVWFGSQAIDLRICNGERLASPEEFRPTAEEIRVMNYFALIKGVKGLLFWAGSGSPTPGVYNDLTEYPAQWQEALRIASEVRYLSPVLAAGELVQTVRLELKSPAIYYRELKHEGEHTLIALNMGLVPATVTWCFERPVQPVALFEDRTLSESGTVMSDKFEPGEVHIYRWK